MSHYEVAVCYGIMNAFRNAVAGELFDVSLERRLAHTIRLRDARLLHVLQIAEARRLALEELPQIVEARGLRSWRQLVQAEDVLVVRDYWLSWWDDLETECHLLDVFMPEGRFGGYTKLLSYDGAAAANADIGYIGHDLGN